MSARKADVTPSLGRGTVEARQAKLSLSPDAVVIHPNGIEFRSDAPFSNWTEMTLTLQSPWEDGRVNCPGVVISCAGNKHTGYRVSMVFTSLTKQAQARLSQMAYAQLS